MGLVVTGFVDLFHHNILAIGGDVGSIKHDIVRHLFSVVWGTVDVIMWKGLWDGVDHWFGEGLAQSRVTFLIGLSVLMVARSLKSALSMPVSNLLIYKLSITDYVNFRLELWWTILRITFMLKPS